MRILLVEDDEINRLIVLGVLQNDGHQVEVAENGLQALEAVATETFDVVLMDRHMPEMGGLEATRRIRTMEGPNATLPVIGVTAANDDREIASCLEAGMNDCLTKPVEAVKLRSLLENLGGGNKSPVPAPAPVIDDEDPVATGPDQPPIDLGRLFRIIGEEDEAELFFMLDVFNSEFPKLLGNLDAAIQERDVRSVHDCAHAAKGAAANAAALVLCEILKRIEVDAHLENWDRIEERSVAVKSEHDRIVRFCDDRQQKAKVT